MRIKQCNELIIINIANWNWNLANTIPFNNSPSPSIGVITVKGKR